MNFFLNRFISNVPIVPKIVYRLEVKSVSIPKCFFWFSVLLEYLLMLLLIPPFFSQCPCELWMLWTFVPSPFPAAHPVAPCVSRQMMRTEALPPGFHRQLCVLNFLKAVTTNLHRDHRPQSLILHPGCRILTRPTTSTWIQFNPTRISCAFCFIFHTLWFRPEPFSRSFRFFFFWPSIHG